MFLLINNYLSIIILFYYLKKNINYFLYYTLGSRVPFNTLTGVIDANTVYSVTEDYARYLKS